MVVRRATIVHFGSYTVPMAKAASPPPTDADLAKARLLIARSDKAKKTRKPKGKGANLDQENNDPNEAKKKKAAISVAFVILLNACFILTDIFIIGGHTRTHTISPTSCSPLLKTMPCGRSRLASIRAMLALFRQVERKLKTITVLLLLNFSWTRRSRLELLSMMTWRSLSMSLKIELIRALELFSHMIKCLTYSLA